MFHRNRGLRAAVICMAVMLLATSLPLVSFAAYENTHVNTGNQAADLVAVAKTQVGYVEGTNNYNKYAESYGNANQPWCGYFISWCARQAGIPKAVIPDAGLASAFYGIGTYHSRTSGYVPQIGDILLYDYNYNNSPDHVSIVEKYTASTKTVTVIDGNWSDKVSNHTASMSNADVMGFVTPAYTTKVTELSAFNLVKPSVQLKGKSFSIGGLVMSPHKITSVTVAVQNAEGKAVINVSATPNTTGYDIAELDAKVAFGTLAVGEYTYVISATDASGASKRWPTAFEVVDKVTMSITDVKAPVALDLKQTFSISGTVTCLEPLSTVSVSVYDEGGTYKTGGTNNPGSTSYNIKGVDALVSFGSLSAGKHIMRVAARSASAYTTWDYPFTVGITPEFSVEKVVSPSVLTVGEAFTVGGAVSCTTPLEAVSVMILAEDKTQLYTHTEKMQQYEFDVAAIADKLDFTVLESGSYYFRIGASSDGVVKEWLQPFTVSDACRIETVVKAYPTVLAVGEGYTVKGTVTGSSAMDTVGMWITDAQGSTVSEAAAVPESTVYDLSELAEELDFVSLAEGSYMLHIEAVAGDVKETVTYSFKVVEVPETAPAGDVNMDGTVSMIDAMLLYNHVAGKTVLTAAQLSRAGSENIGMITCMQLYRFVAGVSATYP